MTAHFDARARRAARPAASRGAAPATPPEAPARALDRIDRRIVIELQRDATVPLARLAERVGLSQTPCWKRVQRLEETGVLTRRVALADAGKLGLGLTAFVTITAPDPGPAWRAAFAAAVATLPGVVEAWRVAGGADYVLKVVAADLAAFDAIFARLADAVELRAASSQFATERVAFTTALPLAADPA